MEAAAGVLLGVLHDAKRAAGMDLSTPLAAVVSAPGPIPLRRSP